MDNCEYKDPRCATTESCWCTGVPVPPIVTPNPEANLPPNPWETDPLLRQAAYTAGFVAAPRVHEWGVDNTPNPAPDFDFAEIRQRVNQMIAREQRRRRG